MFSQETGKKSKKGSKKREVVTFNDSEDGDSEEEHNGKKFCQHHGTYGCTTDECTTPKVLAKQAKQKKGKHFQKKKRLHHGTETGEKGHEKEEEDAY